MLDQDNNDFESSVGQSGLYSWGGRLQASYYRDRCTLKNGSTTVFEANSANNTVSINGTAKLNGYDIVTSDTLKNYSVGQATNAWFAVEADSAVSASYATRLGGADGPYVAGSILRPTITVNHLGSANFPWESVRTEALYIGETRLSENQLKALLAKL